MTPRKRWLVILIIMVFGVALVLSGIAMFQTTHQNSAKTPGNTKPAEALDELTGISIKVPGKEKDGYWNLTVAKMAKNQTLAQMVEIRGEYIQNQRAVYHLTAPSGSIDWRTRTIEVNGGVRFWTLDGRTLVAERVRWDPAKERVSAERQVKLTTPTLTLSTAKLDATLGLDRLQLSGLTKVTYRR